MTENARIHYQINQALAAIATENSINEQDSLAEEESTSEYESYHISPLPASECHTRHTSPLPAGEHTQQAGPSMPIQQQQQQPAHADTNRYIPPLLRIAREAQAARNARQGYDSTDNHSALGHAVQGQPQGTAGDAGAAHSSPDDHASYELPSGSSYLPSRTLQDGPLLAPIGTPRDQGPFMTPIRRPNGPPLDQHWWWRRGNDQSAPPSGTHASSSSTQPRRLDTRLGQGSPAAPSIRADEASNASTQAGTSHVEGPWRAYQQQTQHGQGGQPSQPGPSQPGPSQTFAPSSPGSHASTYPTGHDWEAADVALSRLERTIQQARALIPRPLPPTIPTGAGARGSPTGSNEESRDSGYHSNELENPGSTTQENARGTQRAYHPMRAALERQGRVVEDPQASGSNDPRFSAQYKGSRSNKNASLDDLPDSECTCLWIMQLPADVSYHELLLTARGFGRVFCSHINFADGKKHPKSAAKLAFFEPEAAARYKAHSETKGFVIRGHLLKVIYNRIRMARYIPRNPRACRVLIITGHIGFVNKDVLFEYLSHYVTFDVDEFILRSKNGVIACVELRLGSYRNQAQAIHNLLDVQRPWCMVDFAYGEDPCDVKEPSPKNDSYVGKGKGKAPRKN